MDTYLIDGVKVTVSDKRVDVYPSPMPAAWHGTLVIQRVALEGDDLVWAIVSNNAPIKVYYRSTERDDVISRAIQAIGAWLVETGAAS